MRERSLRVEHGLPLVLDIVGTGGDGARRSTFRRPRRSSLRAAASRSPNTATAPRRASAAVPTCSKRSASQIESDPEVSARLLRESRFAFLFAQRHHPAMRAVGPVRRELGVRTIFNVLGPLTNPAGATRQVIGVAREQHLTLLAEALQELGSEAGCGRAFDERARRSRRRGADHRRAVRRGRRAALGARSGRRTACTRRSSDCAAATRRSTPPLYCRSSTASVRRARTCVALNAALALVVAGAATDINEGMERARAAIASGAARGALDALRAGAPQGGRNVNDMLDKLYAAKAVGARRRGGARTSRRSSGERAATRDERTPPVPRGAADRRGVRRSSPRSSAPRRRSG